jgi:hypothetical protein
VNPLAEERCPFIISLTGHGLEDEARIADPEIILSVFLHQGHAIALGQVVSTVHSKSPCSSKAANFPAWKPRSSPADVTAMPL